MSLSPKEVGPGTEMKLIFSQLGIYPRYSCECNARARQMDEWGVDGCKDPKNRKEIVDWLTEQQRIRTWSQTLRDIASGVRAIVKGDLPWLNPLDLPSSILDEAIRRAEKKAEILKRDTNERDAET